MKTGPTSLPEARKKVHVIDLEHNAFASVYGRWDSERFEGVGTADVLIPTPTGGYGNTPRKWALLKGLDTNKLYVCGLDGRQEEPQRVTRNPALLAALAAKGIMLNPSTPAPTPPAPSPQPSMKPNRLRPSDEFLARFGG